MAGDVDFKAVLKTAAAATPVPGGVGPMTIAMLMVNTINELKVLFQYFSAVKNSKTIGPLTG